MPNLETVFNTLKSVLAFIQAVAKWVIAVSTAAAIIWKWRAIRTFLRQRLGGKPALLVGVTGASYPHSIKLGLTNLSTLNTLVNDVDVTNDVGGKFNLRVGLPIVLKPDSSADLEVFSTSLGADKTHTELRVKVSWTYIENEKVYSQRVSIPITDGSLSLSKHVVRKRTD